MNCLLNWLKVQAEYIKGSVRASYSRVLKGLEFNPSPYKRTARAFNNICYGGSGSPYEPLHKHGCSSGQRIRALH